MKVRLITLLVSWQREEVIGPLLKILPTETLAAQRAIIMGLETLSSLMTPDVLRLSGLVRQVVSPMKLRVTLSDRLFLRRFAKEHKELAPVVALLQAR